jgi:predicted phage terminase large subunit-like protein
MWCNPAYKPHWYHKVIADVLDKWIKHEIRNLIIVMPPRHGKTELASRNLPAYILGRNPKKLIIAAAATAELAEANSRDVKRIMRSEEHVDLFGDVFSEKGALVKDTEKVWQLKQGGTYNAVGTGNNIAGRGADYIIVDDYVNNREQAESDTQRDKQWQWFLDDIITRRHYPASTLVMATRWHFDDIIGRIEEGQHSEPWTIIHFPKMLEGKPGVYDLRKEDGEMLLSPFSLAPWEYLPGQEPPPYDDFLEREPILVSMDEIQLRERDSFEKRRAKNAYGVAALEQGQPVPKGGGLFQSEWIMRYQGTPESMAGRCDQIYISIDASFKDTKNSDNCAIVAFGKRGHQLYLIDADVGKMAYTALKPRTKIMAEKYPSATIIIEDKANGSALVAELKKELPRVIAFDPTPYGNKQVRAELAADRYQGGSILHPAMKMDWVESLEAELCTFPYAKRDDQVDAVSQCVLFVDQKRTGLDRLNKATNSLLSIFGG